MPKTVTMTERIHSLVGKLSQETLMILAVGLTVLVSMFAGWNSLAGQIEGLRIAMHEGDTRLRQERREDVAGLRGEMGELRSELRGEMGKLRSEMGELRSELRGEMRKLRSELYGEMGKLRSELYGEMGKLRKELRGEMGELRTEVRAMGQKIDRLAESLIYVMADMKRRRETPDPGSGVPESHAPKGESP